jgi:hypothetical protein
MVTSLKLKPGSPINHQGPLFLGRTFCGSAGSAYAIGDRSSRRREVNAPHEAEHPFLDRLGPGARITLRRATYP